MPRLVQSRPVRILVLMVELLLQLPLFFGCLPGVLGAVIASTAALVAAKPSGITRSVIAPAPCIGFR